MSVSAYPHWYNDPKKVKRIHRHLRWFYTDDKSVAKGLKPKGVKLPSINEGSIQDETKTLIKDAKHLLGVLKKGQTWGTSLDDPKAFQLFIDELHYPSRVCIKEQELPCAAQKRGIERRRDRRRPKLTGVRAKAQAVIDHPGLRVTCYNSSTGGTAKVGLVEIVADNSARVASPEAEDQGRYTAANEHILDALLDLGDANRSNPACITCIINGDHSSDSQHYDFEAYDVDKNAGGTNRVNETAHANGLTCLNEDNAHYHVHT